MWLTTHGSILTKDILLHRGWKGKDASCIFCDCNETIDHLFFGCAVARVVFLVLYSQKKKNVPSTFSGIGPWILRFPCRVRNSGFNLDYLEYLK
jgi:hypothetical protein